MAGLAAGEERCSNELTVERERSRGLLEHRDERRRGQSEGRGGRVVATGVANSRRNCCCCSLHTRNVSREVLAPQHCHPQLPGRTLIRPFSCWLLFTRAASRNRMRDDTDSPGPAVYFADVGAVKQRNQAWTMPRSERDPPDNRGVPGPGALLDCSHKTRAWFLIRVRDHKVRTRVRV